MLGMTAGPLFSGAMFDQIGDHSDTEDEGDLETSVLFMGAERT